MECRDKQPINKQTYNKNNNTQTDMYACGKLQASQSAP